MTLMNLLLLGLGYKVVSSAMKTSPAQSGTATAQSLAPDAQPGAVMQKGLITPVQSGENWEGDVRHRKTKLRDQAWDVGFDDVDMTTQNYLEEIYGGRAIPAEADPLSVGAKEEKLHQRNKVAQSYTRHEAQKDKQIYEAEVAAEYYDVDDANPQDVMAQRVRFDSQHGRDLAMDADLERRARIAEAVASDTDANLNARANERHGKMLARSIKRTVSPDMDMAMHQEYRGQARRGFAKNPDAGFGEISQPVSVREGNYSQTEVLPADDFENNLSAGNLGFKQGYKDWPQTVQQKSQNSDFSGVLVNEKGSADFSHDIVYDVDSDFGG